MVRRGLFVVGTLLLLIAVVGLVQAEFGAKPGSANMAMQDGGEQANTPRRRTLFEGLSGMLDSVDDSQMTDEQRDLFNDQKAQLKEMYREADSAWGNTKAEMREAIRQVNRQVRVPRRTPNVILITADGLGINDLGIYRQDLAKQRDPAEGTNADSNVPAINTPYLDALAQTGVRFSDYYVGAPSTVPANATLATGLHTGHVRLRGSRPVMPLADADVTLAEVMWYGGFRTGFVGAWSLGEPGTSGIPRLQGFDYSFGYLSNSAAGDFYPAALWRNTEQVAFIANENDGNVLDAQSLLTQDAMAFLDRQGNNRPFFLQIDFTLPADGPSDTGEYKELDWPVDAKKFAAMVTKMDRDIGRVMERLYALGFDANTLVVFAGDVPIAGNTDHWDFFDSNGPFNGLPGELSEGGLRAPMIVSWPRALPEDVIVSDPCAAWDIMPTLAELTGTWKLPRSLGGQAVLDGQSLLPSIYGAPAGDRALYWEQHDGGFAQAIRVGPWKAARLGVNGPISLYDLGVDPGETSNVASDHGDVAQRLGELMDDAHWEDQNWPAR